jgi:lysyl-tRNA synthetase class 2
MAIHGQPIVKVGEHEINFAGPYEKLTMYESIQKYTGIDVSAMSEEEIKLLM